MSNPRSPAPDLSSAPKSGHGNASALRQLVPPFILSRAARGELEGSLPAVVLFADISGFTPLTTRLMEHGAEGAEVLAQVLMAVFEPLVELVHAHGGFVAGYAGDALKAIFPAEGLANAPALTVHVGMAMTRHMAAHPVQTTRFGEFAFSVKISIAHGPVTWRIWRTPARGHGGQRAAFVLGGVALSAALALDPYATAGAVVTTCELLDHLPHGHFAVERFVDSARVVTEDLPESHDHPRRLDSPGDMQRAAYWVDSELAFHAAEFFPASLLKRTVQGEFRQVTTVFLNLQADPADMDARADSSFSEALFGLISQYEGHLCRVGQIGAKDSGMTLMLLWGAPSSHENDAARALGFLLDLQAALAVPLRAGVTTGLVYAGFVGAPRQEEYTCYGAQVNLAARQLVAAQWDEILVDDVTARRGGTEFELTDAGARSFKGFAAPRRVFQVRQRRSAAQQPFYQGACVGRHAELAQLTSAVEPILAGRFGGVITLVGEVGMGKSRLAFELMAQLEKPGAFEKLGVVDAPPQWLLCQTDEVMRRPLNPFRYWLRRYFDQSPAQGEAVNQHAFARRLADLFANLAQTPVATAHAPNAVEARAEQLVAELNRTRSFLGALVDLRWADSLYERLEPQLRLENTLDALKTLIKAESLRRPLILHVEDVHWLDPESQTFLQQLARNVDEYPFAMLLSARPAESVAAAGELAATTILPATFPAGVPQTVVRLAAFTRAELEALARSLLGGPAASSLVDLVEHRAEGNPFFAEQILLYLRENGHLASTPDEWRLREDVATTLPMGAAVLPADVRTVLTARLDRLADPVREIVQTAAVLGREFDPLVLAQMQTSPIDGPPGDLPGLLDAAQKAGIWAAIDRGRYLFRHTLLRDAAYDMQLRARLRTLHRRAGAAVEQIYHDNLPPHAGELAYHFDLAEEPATAAHWYGIAGDLAIHQYANHEAVRHYTRALELTPATAVERRYDLLSGREAACNWLGRRDAQLRDVEELEELAALLGDARRQAEAALRHAAFDLNTGRYQEAIYFAVRSAAFAEEAGDGLAQARALHRWGRSYWQMGDYAHAQPYLERALELARAGRGQVEEAECLYDLGCVAYYQEQFARALDLSAEAATLYAALEDRRGQTVCLSLNAVTLDRLGDNHAAIAPFAQARQLCREAGWRYAEARLLAQSANNDLNLGDLAGSRRQHEEAVAICREIDDREGIATSLDALGLVLSFQDRPEEARSRFEEALAIHRAMNDPRGQGYALTHLGYALIQLEEPEAAEEALRQAVAVRRTGGEGGLLVDTLAGLAWAALLRAAPDDALPYVTEIQTWLDSNGVTGIEFPIQVYLICQRVLRAAASRDPAHARAAAQMLAAGHGLLQERAARIPDNGLRAQFLTNIPFHRELLRAWSGA